MKTGPAAWPRGVLQEGDLVRRLDELIELKPGRTPATLFLLLISPHRNGNSDFMSHILPKVGTGRMVSRLAIEQSEGNWDPEQYPRLLHALIPEFRTSAERRERLRRRYSPLATRLLFFSVDLLLPAVAFLMTEILIAFGLGNFSSPPSLSSFLGSVLHIPLWSHAMGLGVGGGVDLLHRKREGLLARFRFRDQPEPGFRLSGSDLALLKGKEGSFQPILDRLRDSLPGPAVIWVDRADGLDSLSRSALTSFIAQERPSSNRLLVLHFGDREAPWYREIRKDCSDLANPEERVAEIELDRIPLEDRKRIAAALGKTEQDAVAVSLVADLQEMDEPRLQALRNEWRDLLEGDLAVPSAQSGPSLLLALLASAGVDGPRQFGRSELQAILTPQKGTYARWAEVFGKTAWYPNPLRNDLQFLEHADPVPLLERRETLNGDVQLVVPPDVRRVVLESLDSQRGWAGAVYSFWASYHGERLEAEKQRVLASIVELCRYLMHLRFQREERFGSTESAQVLARSLLLAANRAVSALIDMAQFDLAHAVLVRVLEEILPVEDLWGSDAFIREIERLSEQAWRLAAVRGASREILAFQKLLGERGARSGAKGIEVSVAIYDVYSRAINLEPIDRNQALALRIAGGDEVTRARLENLRRYGLNVTLLRKSTLVLEGLELFAPDPPSALLPLLLDPVPSPRLDFFELLVGFQSARARLALGNFHTGLRLLREMGERLLTAEGTQDKEDLFEHAVWSLCLAEARLTALESFHRLGPFLLSISEDFRELLTTIFDVQIEGATSADFAEKLSEEVADSLEDALLIQELCRISFGLAYLMNAKVRYGAVLASRSDPSASREVNSWATGVQIAKDLGCRHLQMGTLLVRAKIRREVETCVSCMRSACEEALRQGLEEPLLILAPVFADFVLKLDSQELYKVSSEVLRFSLDHFNPAPGDEALLLRHRRISNLYAQFVRLLGDPKAALAVLAPGLSLDLSGFADEHLRDAARDCVLSSRLQACWCYERIGDDNALASCLDETLKIDECDRWGGYPHLVQLRFGLEFKSGASAEEAVRRAVGAFAQQGWRASYDQRGLLALVCHMLRAANEYGLKGRLRAAVIDAARVMLERLSEWFGIEAALELLNLALHTPELSSPELRGLYESYVAREAMMEQRLRDLNQQLGGGRPEALLEYLLRRFAHRIAVRDEPGTPGQALLDQLEKTPQAVTRDQIERALPRADEVQAQDGVLFVAPALPALLRLQRLGQEEGHAANVLRRDVGAALWSATEHMLRIMANGSFVHPKLAEAMLTYLRISEAFSPMAGAT